MDPGLLPMFAQARQAASRSGVLQPFGNMVWCLTAALVFLASFPAPGWVLVVVAGLLGVVILTALCIGVVLVRRGHYFALLSERYNLGAMAMGVQKYGSSDEHGTFQPSHTMMPALPFEKVIDIAAPSRQAKELDGTSE